MNKTTRTILYGTLLEALKGLPDNATLSPAQVEALLRPFVEEIAKRHGRREAVRLFREAVVAAGIDPQRDANRPGRGHLVSLARDQRLACALATCATTPGEIEAAHVAMRRAFPRLSAAYPCDCLACTAEQERLEAEQLAAHDAAHGYGPACLDPSADFDDQEETDGC